MNFAITNEIKANVERQQLRETFVTVIADFVILTAAR